MTAAQDLFEDQRAEYVAVRLERLRRLDTLRRKVRRRLRERPGPVWPNWQPRMWRRVRVDELRHAIQRELWDLGESYPVDRSPLFGGEQ